MLNRQFDLQPSQLNSKAFTDKLLRQAENVDELRRYFRAYQAVQSALSDLGYNFVTLDLDMGGPSQNFTLSIFHPRWRERFPIGCRRLTCEANRSATADGSI